MSSSRRQDAHSIGECRLSIGDCRKSQIANRMALRTLILIFCVLAPHTQAQQWTTNSGYRWLNLPVPTAGKIGFARLPGRITGVQFTNQLSDERSITNRNLLSGAGVAAGDIDGDGRCDLFFCRLGGPSVLYRNLGDWKFKDITAQAGVSCDGQDTT